MPNMPSICHNPKQQGVAWDTQLGMSLPNHVLPLALFDVFFTNMYCPVRSCDHGQPCR